MKTPGGEANHIRDSVFRGTKGRILPLLRGPGKTVGELARVLELTGNAVRGHLATLERDGLVEIRDVRRSAAKPSHVYTLTPAGEALFPKAHGAVVGAMIEALRARLSPAEMDAFLRDVAARLPGEAAAPGSPIAARFAAAAAAFAGLGGIAQVEETTTGYAIFCRDCPLGDVASGHAEACAIAGAILEEIVQEPLETCCHRGARPTCRFELRAAGQKHDAMP